MSTGLVDTLNQIDQFEYISIIEMRYSEFIPVHVFSISNHPEQDQDIITDTSNVSSYTKTPLVMASWPIR